MLNPKNLKQNEEQYEYYIDSRGRRCCQYDYRAEDGKLFSCVRATLERCRTSRDEWLKRK